MLMLILTNRVGQVRHRQHRKDKRLHSTNEDTKRKPDDTRHRHPDWHKLEQDDDENLTCKDITK